MTPRLSAIIPAYNEENRLEKVLSAAERYIAERPETPTEILVVDDGSRDGTVALAESWVVRIPTLRVLQNPRNMGKGATIRHGMREATGEWRLFTDADNSTDFHQVDRLIERAVAARADVAFGSRALRESELAVRQPARRELMGRLFNLVVQSMALPGVRDSQCGFKLFSAEAADAIFQRITRDGFSFDVEALYIARRLGFAAIEVPIRWEDDARTSVAPVRDGLGMLKDLFLIRREHKNLGPDWASHPHSTEELAEVQDPAEAPRRS